VQQLTVDVVALDDIWDAVVGPTDRTLLKIDTQGYENAVLDGVEHHLNDVALVEIEMALTELYLGGSTIHSLLPRLHAGGFDVISIDSGFVNAATGQVLDVDMLLGRRG
jgi:hypothetical protein